MEEVRSDSVHLVVTSPPYPMIEMWDNIFADQNPLIKDTLDRGHGAEAFERMHGLLDPIWTELYRVLIEGGIACINIGDATRTIGGNFALYPNHMRVLKFLLDLGFTALPCILWRKQTNAPNKFMGSGTLPAGAYVTLEHEYILILRKGPRREFKTETEKKRRRESSIFWEERNRWYSDVWFDVKGTLQTLNANKTRSRSAAFPFEMVYRLINMYSVKEDTVLDPFSGTGTTTAACIASGRNSIGYEMDAGLKDAIFHSLNDIENVSNQYLLNRINRHLSFVKTRLADKIPIKYQSRHYGFQVIMSQETQILLNEVIATRTNGTDSFEAVYADKPRMGLMPEDHHRAADNDRSRCESIERSMASDPKPDGRQLPLF